MLLVLSPSKTLDTTSEVKFSGFSQPDFLNDAARLVTKLRSFSQAELAAMMELSDKLAVLNVQRFRDFHVPFTPENARPAMLTFKGDVYEPIDVAAYGKREWTFAQAHVRILSGLYGLLRPLDLIQPYRLEMGRKLAVGKTKDLYGFWGGRLSQALAKELSGHKAKLLVNLASEEYAAAVDRRVLGVPVIDVVFKEHKDGKDRIIGLFAKRARGMMADFIIRNQIDKPGDLKEFDAGGYRFMPGLSGDATITFIRKNS